MSLNENEIKLQPLAERNCCARSAAVQSKPNWIFEFSMSRFCAWLKFGVLPLSRLIRDKLESFLALSLSGFADDIDEILVCVFDVSAAVPFTSAAARINICLNN